MLDESDIKKVAALSRLGLSPEEIKAATKNVGGILEHFSAIQAIDTKGVVPADEERATKNITRPDEAKPNTLTSAKVLMENAPRTHQGQLQVSAVFESNE